MSKLIDYAGLVAFWTKAKAFINSEDASVKKTIFNLFAPVDLTGSNSQAAANLDIFETHYKSLIGGFNDLTGARFWGIVKTSDGKVCDGLFYHDGTPYRGIVSYVNPQTKSTELYEFHITQTGHEDITIHQGTLISADSLTVNQTLLDFQDKSGAEIYSLVTHFETQYKLITGKDTLDGARFVGRTDVLNGAGTDILFVHTDTGWRGFAMDDENNSYAVHLFSEDEVITLNKYTLSTQASIETSISTALSKVTKSHNAGVGVSYTLPTGVTKDDVFNLETKQLGTSEGSTYIARILTALNADRSLKQFSQVSSDNGSSWSDWVQM
jgi:hypothetical protein